MTFKSASLELKCTLYHVRGLFLVYTNVLAILSAFTAFQVLINCCIWWVSAAESLGEQSPEGLCGCGKYLQCNTDIVEWFTHVLERSNKPIDQHQARRGCGHIGQGKGLHNDGGQVELVVFTCLWHLNCPYQSYDLPQVTGFKIQGEILISSVFGTTYIKSCKTVPMVSLF